MGIHSSLIYTYIKQIRAFCIYLRDVVERGDGEADWEHVPPPADRLEREDHGVHPLHVDADRHAHGANPA